MNHRLLQWSTLASSIAVSLALGAFAVGCSGADPSSTGDLGASAPAASEHVTTQVTTNPCGTLYLKCLDNGGDDTTCMCELDRCRGVPLPLECRPQFQ